MAPRPPLQPTGWLALFLAPLVSVLLALSLVAAARCGRLGAGGEGMRRPEPTASTGGASAVGYDR